ncbi:MAG TPA: tetratricopeptide repeat protein, partial [bacterium]|nr:tetratricopeptide repeat protein [bacterium]
YLGTLLGLEIKEAWRDRVQYLDGEALGRQIYRSTRLFFAALAQERPLVLMIEDLHWIDHSSAELLEHLLPLSTEVPILFYGITRPGRDTPMARLRDVVLRDYVDRYTEVSLQPLSPEHSDELVRNLLQVSDLPAGVRHLVLERSEGNPFFVEEVTRAFIDLGALTRDAAGRWQVSRQIDRISIPDTLRGVIVARIDRLDEDVKQILKTASVIGRNFFYRVLRAIAEAGAELDRYLLDLEQLEFIKERRRDPELEYAFKHALTQEATYETILLRVRRELHRRVAETIEQLFAGRLEEFYGLLAYHYARVENWERAQEYLFKAGDQAVRMAADAEALSYYQQASAAYARAFGDRWDPLQRAILERKMGEALFRRGQHDQAMEYLQRALVHLGHPFPSSRWGVLFTILGQLIRQVGHRLLPSVFLRYPADRPPPPAAEERARIYEAMGWIDYFLSVNRLILEGLLLLNVSEQNRFLFGIARGSMAMGLVCDLIPAFGLAGSYHRRAVAVAEQIQHPLALGLTYLGLALHELHVGEWDSALQHFRRSAASYREAGELRQWGAAASVEAWLLRMRGEFQSSLELDHEMIRVGEEAADPQLRGWGLTEKGNTLWQIGNVDEAIPALREAVELFRAVPDYRWVVLATSGLGMCYLRQGRTEEALSVFEDAHRIIVDRGFKGFLGAVPRGGLTEVYLAAAEAARDGSRDAWLKKADRLSREFLTQSKTDIEAVPAAHRLRGQLAWLRGERRQAIQSWQASERVAERLGAKYDLALTAFELGHRTADEVQLRRAQTIFADIGARWDPAR